ncbi:hypothetical protein [Sphingopyxis sp. MWB1]|uniref:hypothetical protein n=1 Tax=Sphingopyxis sp. MWB1 TaxID=1537715 RepID=UPI00051A10A5|nr:hypothetical protein [Sphingopyxis sp. MWB1]
MGAIIFFVLGLICGFLLAGYLRQRAGVDMLPPFRRPPLRREIDEDIIRGMLRRGEWDEAQALLCEQWRITPSEAARVLEAIERNEQR